MYLYPHVDETMDSKVIIMLVILLAVAAQAAPVSATINFYWFKCESLVQPNKTFIVIRGVMLLPMIGMELKMLNTTNPKTAFEEIRQICLAPVRELSKHLNKTVNVYRQLKEYYLE
jgi:hypothetical protein